MFRIQQGFRILKNNFFTSHSNSVRYTMKSAFGKYLLLTNTATSGVLMLLGDLVQQEIEYQQKKLSKRYDYGRLGRMFFTGLIFGPLHHYYYSYINRKYPGRDFNSICKKIMVDQFIVSPICILTFFYTVGLLEGKTGNQCNEEIQEKFINVYVMDWCVWPPVQYLNFYYMPPKYQVLYINAATMLYNVFLSYIKHKETVAVDKQKYVMEHISLSHSLSKD